MKFRENFTGLSSSVGRAQGWKLWGRWFESNLRQMSKLLLSYVLKGLPFIFLSNKQSKKNNIFLVIPDYILYYLTIHVKFCSRTRESQLVEIFAYENLVSSTEESFRKNSSTILSYQFHNTFSQERLFIFASSLVTDTFPSPKSVQDLYASSWWLEREVGEMHGICFENKKDLRNLMLQYGDASSPFKKSYPSVGYKEVVYDTVTDHVVQVPVSLQV